MIIFDRKPVVFMGQTRKQIRDLAFDIRREFGHSVRDVQIGLTPLNARRMAGSLREVMEICADDRSGTYRLMYTTQFEGRVYVLDVFQKKSKSGIATPHADVQRILQRLKAAKAHFNSELI